jgi:hypothetical protein
MAKVNHNARVLWKGLSQLDNEPIMLLATGFNYSTNQKTGNMVQTYILRQDVNPSTAQNNGMDLSICGNCPLRPTSGTRESGVCYVTTAQGGIDSSWNSWSSGRVRDIQPEEWAQLFSYRYVRIGSYGDPVAVPVEVWTRIIEHSQGHTGYTHQWRRKVAQDYKFLQASCSSMGEVAQAKQLGWNVYVNLPLDVHHPVGFSGIQCPAQTDGIKCIDCRMCDGRTGDIWCHDHGLAWKSRKTSTQKACPVTA